MNSPVNPADSRVAPRREGFSRSTVVPLYWREDGREDAPTALLLHGGPGAHHDYLYPQMLALASTHRVITYDQRGGGRSKTDDPAPITWETQVSDLTALWAEFELEAPLLVGYSWGALLAMLYTMTVVDAGAALSRMPSRLALLSPAPISRAWRTEFETELARRQRGPEIEALRAELTASGLRETNVDAYRQRSFEISVAGYFADPAAARSLTPFRVTGRVQQSIWESLGDFDLRLRLHMMARAVPLPVLVVHGTADPIPLASALAVAQALNATFIELAACGHVPYVEQPQALFDALARFAPT